jgi:opacity protein-like surface antigen
MRCSHALPAAAVLLAAGFHLPAAADAPRFYIRGLIGYDWSRDATFKDENCASTNPPAYFGCGPGVGGLSLGARGDFGGSALYEIGAGVEVLPYLRVEAAIDHRPGLAFDGNANFRNAGGDQPVSGDVTQSAVMGMAYLEPFTALGADWPVKPFIGGGVGVSRNEIGGMRYDFPALPQPAYSAMPGGTQYDFTWAATAGFAFDVTERLSLDIAYRYSDLGDIETDSKTLYIKRPTWDLTIPIAPTKAELITQSVNVSARFRF